MSSLNNALYSTGGGERKRNVDTRRNIATVKKKNTVASAKIGNIDETAIAIVTMVVTGLNVAELVNIVTMGGMTRSEGTVGLAMT